jgi:4-hydroxybenzoate polyprenyltransferase
MLAIIRKTTQFLAAGLPYHVQMSRKLVALLLSTHPGPSLAVTAIAIALGIAVGLEPWRVVVLGLAVASNQASVGWSNDWIDAERDARVGRVDKPVAQGRIAAATVRNFAFAGSVVAIVLTIPLGLAATAAHLVFLVSAWSYNAGLKRTAFSVLPYILSFGILPAVVTLSSSSPAGAAPWALATGALLGIAAHFANVLPDLDDDAATGVRGLPHRLGRATVATLTYIVLASATVTAVFGSTGLESPWAFAALLVNLVIAGFGLANAGRAIRLHFQLIIAAALVIVAMLVAAGDQLLTTT